jgi:hypothetical protein
MSKTRGQVAMHARLRFKERHGRELSSQEYEEMCFALTSGWGEVLRVPRTAPRTAGNLMQLIWNDAVLYPVFNASQYHYNTINTFLTPDMVLSQLYEPYLRTETKNKLGFKSYQLICRIHPARATEDTVFPLCIGEVYENIGRNMRQFFFADDSIEIHVLMYLKY